MEDLTIAGMLTSHKLVDTAAIKVLGAMRYLNANGEAVKDGHRGQTSVSEMCDPYALGKQPSQVEAWFSEISPPALILRKFLPH